MRPVARDADGFLGRLNKPRPVTARYRVVAADYEPPQGSGMARMARDALIDRVFDDAPNDLIVPTWSAYQWNGATGFPVSERVVLPSSRGVDHSTFWTAPEVAAALETWLRPDEATLWPSPLVGLAGLAAGPVACRWRWGARPVS